MAYVSKESAVRLLQESPPFIWQSATGFEKVALQRRSQLLGDVRADGILNLEYDGEIYRFAVQITESSSTAALQAACQLSMLSAKCLGLPPLVVVPYLRDEQMKMFRESRTGLNVIDLCGNAMISIPGLHVLQRGELNKFPDSRRIKNPFRGNSSLVGRVLLKQPWFSSITAIHSAIMEGGCSLGVPAISKSISELADELIVKREGSSIMLWDSEVLLRRLAENYRTLQAETMDLKIDMNEEAIPGQITAVGNRIGVKVCATGRSSFTNYAGGSTHACVAYYVDSALDNFVQQLKKHTEFTISKDSIFPNTKLVYCPDQVVFFDHRAWMNGLAASPVQTYVELWNGDPRETEIAERVKEVITEELLKKMAEHQAGERVGPSPERF
jgi:hypothetical protein